MIVCCGEKKENLFKRVLRNSETYSRSIEYAYCANCGNFIFRDIRYFSNGTDKLKELKGKNAVIEYNRLLRRLAPSLYGSKSKQNTYYGSFKKTKRKDSNGNVIYLQVRKNFNNQSEILGQIDTLYSKI